MKLFSVVRVIWDMVLRFALTFVLVFILGFVLLFGAAHCLGYRKPVEESNLRPYSASELAQLSAQYNRPSAKPKKSTPRTQVVEAESCHGPACYYDVRGEAAPYLMK